MTGARRLDVLDSAVFPLDAWAPTKDTIHRQLQLVGKLRLAMSPRRNHWWNVPFHVTATGVTTRPMGGSPVFAVDLDFVDQRLLVTTDEGRRSSFPLAQRSIASFHTALVEALLAVGVDPSPILMARPFDLPDDDVLFRDDDTPRPFDGAAAHTYARMLGEANLLLEEFCGRFSGKTSPVHHFWHTFDLATTRFSDAVVAQDAKVDAVTREAYSREVSSAGFWFGDADTPEPAFYAYTSPEPGGLHEQPLVAGARWQPRGASHLAVYPLTAAQRTGDVRSAALAFLEAAYRAGATLAGWDVDRLACIDGVTDPVVATRRS